MDRLYASYLDIPPITRTWASLTVAMAILTQLQVLSPFHLYFDTFFIYKRQQYWRLFTSYFFVAPFGVDFLFHIYILSRYSRLLEEGSYRNRPADFALLLIGSALLTLVIAHLLPTMPSTWALPFLSGPVTSALTYVWARRNPFLRMSLFGLFEFQAPFLPWAMAGLSALLHGAVPTADLLGLGIGHVYWFLEDIYPRTVGAGGRARGKVLKTPRFMMLLFGQQPSDVPEVVTEVPPPPPPQQQQQQDAGAVRVPAGEEAAVDGGARDFAGADRDELREPLLANPGDAR
ncbi:Der1-like family-domain-containing protein [Catenaria anguillulae PL171]|uniref:Derlin n=1 Tax=Catenaria anguillulae PL171 TaxID=765915 RepID=A0A1Y2I2A9_9FUNG|nr:Der1-like family-domain-containing protein [Catenaria anguillulae PL171]